MSGEKRISTAACEGAEGGLATGIAGDSVARPATEDDVRFMREALEEAVRAGRAGDVPVGAVVVRNGVVLARAGNRREQDGMATAHAEILAIEQACRATGYWRLQDCTLYVTLEPCPMCTGATVNARVGRVVY